ncbi:MAG: hypothetical protein RLZ10_3114 [Bacteroidota bacterium]|jgi:hypothetical protein
MENQEIENWLDKKESTRYLPSNELLHRIKQIPYQTNPAEKPIYHWMTWFAAACFVGFMLINLLNFTSKNSDKSNLEAYLPSKSIHGI